MTKATAATIAAALINAGYIVNVYTDGAGTYHVNAQSNSGPIDVQTVATFATNNAVVGKVTAADFT